MSKGLRPEEEWARAMIEKALDVAVVQHDDGSRARMHDLDIVYNDRQRAAVECTAAADPASIELWNLMNSAGPWIATGIKGGWMVALDPSLARAKRIRAELPELLAQAEALGVTEIRPGRKHGVRAPFDTIALDLGIATAGQSGTDLPGSINITLRLRADRSGGFVADTGDALAIWLGDFLHAPERQDVREKLASSGAAERHAFIYIPGFTTAPFSATDLLVRNGAPLPTVAPRLPAELTHVWAVSLWDSGAGFRWFPDEGWAKFEKLRP